MDSKMQKVANIIGYLIGGILVSLAGIAVIAIIDRLNIDNGNVYYTKTEAEQALERKLAEARLRWTSNFEPDWSNNDQNKWTVYYNHNDKELLVEATAFLQYPSAIYFDTYDSIKKSIEENREDWLKYLGIKEW